ncbi:MAG: DUF3592 domain-containing protein [Planctomycetota bacterium]
MKANPSASPGCLILFALPFAAVGVVMAIFLGKSLWLWSSAKGWDEVPATIEHVELIRDTSGDSTTYSVECRYHYEFGRERYDGDRVGLTSARDNLGSYHQDLAARLSAHQASGDPYPCLVNPNDPTQSILDITLRWQMLLFFSVFIVVFGGVGFGMIAWGFVGRRREAARSERKKEQPAAPWAWSEEWSSGIIPTETRSLTGFSFVFALFWNAISWPTAIMFTVDQSGDAAVGFFLLVWLFPAIGVGLIGYGLRNFFHLRKYGPTTYEPVPNPGILGGPVGGFIHVPQSLAAGTEVILSLQCVKTYHSDSADSSDATLWEDQITVRAEAAGGAEPGVRIPVLFAAPHGQPGSTEQGPGATSWFEWRLVTRASTPGLDYRESFVIPVFETDASSPDFKLDDAVRERVTVAEADEELFHRAALRVGHGAGGSWVILAPRGRLVGTGIVLSALAIGFGVAIALAFNSGHPFVAAFLGLFEMAFVFAALELWLERRTVELDSQGITLGGGRYGFGPEVSVPRDEVARVEAKRTRESGSTTFANLILHTKDGKKHRLLSNVPGLAVAQKIAERIEAGTTPAI